MEASGHLEGETMGFCVGVSPGRTDILPPEQESSLINENGMSCESVRSVSTKDKGGLSKEMAPGKNYSRGRKG